jgi:hypothetical protein
MKSQERLEDKFETIIFLDIDGVLNCQRGWEHYIGNGHHSTWDYSKVPKYKYGSTSAPFCPKTVSLLNQLISLTHAKIVIISTWRHGKSIEELQGALTERGVYGKVIDKTISSAGLRRGEEIELWIQENGEPDKFVIIDDDFSYDIDYLYPLNGVQPSEPEGFNEECFQKALDIIG